VHLRAEGGVAHGACWERLRRKLRHPTLLLGSELHGVIAPGERKVQLGHVRLAQGAVRARALAEEELDDQRLDHDWA